MVYKKKKMRKYEKRQQASCLKHDIRKHAEKELDRIHDSLKSIWWFQLRRRILLYIEKVHFERMYLSTTIK